VGLTPHHETLATALQLQLVAAHKIAHVVCHLLKDNTAYHDVGAERCEQQLQERELAHLCTKAARLGYTINVLSRKRIGSTGSQLQDKSHRAFR
jgi:hypothetical protein